jgi:hypothetical protein
VTRIYVCEVEYPEDVLIEVPKSLDIVGGLDCAWKEKAGAKPRFGANSMPMVVRHVDGLRLIDIALEAKDAYGTDQGGDSSIALLVEGGSVELRGVELVAGRGRDILPGMRQDFTFLSSDQARGYSARDSQKPGDEKSFVCPGGGETKGGAGTRLLYTDGQSGAPGPDNGGSYNRPCGAGGSGQNGRDGDVAPAAQGARNLGLLESVGWLPSAGASGEPGKSGQGGGGGSAGIGAAGPGGGGGLGGCGGAGGPGGGGGGASVALALLGASATLVDSVLTSKSAGRGATGVEGQDGGWGGGGGDPWYAGGCSGGSGGRGGKGGAGGGGAGGISFGIIHRGPKPLLDESTLASIRFGAPGDGGQGVANAGRRGSAGKIMDVDAPPPER